MGSKILFEGSPFPPFSLSPPSRGNPRWRRLGADAGTIHERCLHSSRIQAPSLFLLHELATPSALPLPETSTSSTADELASPSPSSHPVFFLLQVAAPYPSSLWYMLICFVLCYMLPLLCTICCCYCLLPLLYCCWCCIIALCS